MSMQLLQRFSSALLFVEYPSAADVSPNLRVFCKKVELSFEVLKVLENANSAPTEGNISPVSRKKGRAVNNNFHINPLPFNSMGLTVPTTDAGIRDVYVGVLSQLRGILEVCGSTTGSLRAGLNNRSTISLSSGSRCYRKFSNPHTSRQNYHREECLPQQRKKESRG
jgi:hypothetical protein